MQTITLKRLAELSGFSISTVSKALSDSHEISEQTKIKIRKLAKDHNYQPNIIAKSLKTGKTNTIGIIIPYLGNPFQSQILEGSHHAAFDHNYKLVFMQSRENADLERDSLIALHNQNVDGIIISPSANSNIAFIEELSKIVPIVLLDRVDFDINLPKIGVNSEKGAAEATQKLIDIGRKDIIVLCGQNIGVTQKRVSGYKKALIANYIDFKAEYVIEVNYGQSTDDMTRNLLATLENVLKRFHKPIGLLGTTDTLTVRTLGILAKLGVKVPEDVAVIGFSNIDSPESLNPPLSCIVQPAVEMGKIGVEKLVEIINSSTNSTLPRDCEELRLETQIILRESTKV